LFLLAYDGSPAAKRALEHAAKLVGRGGELAVINVIPVQSVSARLQTVGDDQRKRQTDILREARELLAGRGIQARMIGAAGDPVAEILAAAEATAADTIVVGRAGRRHLLHGSLSARLVRGAGNDVLVVHGPSSGAR
jgi:nucleotide-binding universal stress UspA family protein